MLYPGVEIGAVLVVSEIQLSDIPEDPQVSN